MRDISLSLVVMRGTTLSGPLGRLRGHCGTPSRPWTVVPGAASLLRGAGVVQDQEDIGDGASSRATKARLLPNDDAIVPLTSALMPETMAKGRLRDVYMSLETLARLTAKFTAICPP